MRLRLKTAWWLGAFIAGVLSFIVLALLQVENTWLAWAVVVLAFGASGGFVGWLSDRGRFR